MNSFQRFLSEGGTREPRRLAWLAAVSGLASAAMLALLNNAVSLAATDGALKWVECAIFAVAFVVYFLAMKLSLKGADALIERLLKNLRVRLTDKIRHSELRIVEALGRGQLFTSVSQSTNQLSQIFPQLVNALQELIVVVFCFLYIGYLSSIAFGVLLLVTVLAIRQFQISRAVAQEQYRQRHEDEAGLLDSLGHIVDGFKEIRINQRKTKALYQTFSGLTEKLRELAFSIAEAQVSLFLITTTFLYMMLAGLAYILPQYIDVDVFRLCAALLFCVGPLAGVVGLMPLVWTAEAGLKSIYDLEEKLSSGIQEPRDPGPSSARLAGFQRICYQGMTFRYKDPDNQESFCSGPWSITLERGELLFLVGGNGSGKSTVLKLLSGLYQAESGVIRVDDHALLPSERAGLRELFSCVFSDYYLFERLYGIEDVAPEKVEALIQEMGLDGKVKYIDGRFSYVALSTGQRKRLALIVSLLEDKALYIFDEWTADQDAQFREHFYQHTLPELKRQGKTVICVTHDDRYWGVADRLIKFEYGRIVDQ